MIRNDETFFEITYDWYVITESNVGNLMEALEGWAKFQARRFCPFVVFSISYLGAGEARTTGTVAANSTFWPEARATSLHRHFVPTQKEATSEKCAISY